MRIRGDAIRSARALSCSNGLVGGSDRRLRIVAAAVVPHSQVSDSLLTRIQSGDLRTTSSRTPLDTLSPRELQVLRLVAEGKTSKDIAVLLDLGLQRARLPQDADEKLGSTT